MINSKGNYFRVHSWMIYHYGNATKCENKECSHKKPKRFEWALIKGKQYEKDRINFKQLCCSCHRKYDITDETRRKMSESKKGNIPKNRRKVILNYIEVFDSLTDGAKSKGISISAIHQNLKGRTNKTQVGIWKYL